MPDREGDLVVLKPFPRKSEHKASPLVESLPVLEGRLTDLAMTFRRDDIYGPDAG